MSKPNILVIGSFVMDQIATTSVFPREGQTVLGRTFSKAPGGKGANQAVQMARLGADVTMCGHLGLDANAEEMLSVLKDAGVNTDHVTFDKENPSACSVIILEETEGEATKNRIIVIPGSNMTYKVQDILFLEDEIENYDLLVLQLEIPMEVNIEAAKIARKHGVPVLLNCAPIAPLPEELLECITYISPNESEAEELTGIKIIRDGKNIDSDSLEKVSFSILEKGAENVILTLGRAGAAFSSPSGIIFSPAIGGDAVDPTAAGDSFIGAFSVAVCAGLCVKDALYFANCAASLTVSKMGAMPSLPHLDDVLKVYDGSPDKLLSLKR